MKTMKLYARMIYLKTEGFRLHSVCMLPDGSAVLQYGLPDELLPDIEDPFHGARTERFSDVDQVEQKFARSLFSKINKDNLLKKTA